MRRRYVFKMTNKYNGLRDSIIEYRHKLMISCNLYQQCLTEAMINGDGKSALRCKEKINILRELIDKISAVIEKDENND